jgi:hypothetical protein
MRYSPEERQAHVTRWQNSGLSKSAYCRKESLPYHCLMAWSRPRVCAPTSLQSEPTPTDSGFVEISDHRSVAALMSSPAVMIELGKGRILAIAGSADPVWAGRLLGTVLGC